MPGPWAIMGSDGFFHFLGKEGLSRVSVRCISFFSTMPCSVKQILGSMQCCDEGKKIFEGSDCTKNEASLCMLSQNKCWWHTDLVPDWCEQNLPWFSKNRVCLGFSNALRVLYSLTTPSLSNFSRILHEECSTILNRKFTPFFMYCMWGAAMDLEKSNERRKILWTLFGIAEKTHVHKALKRQECLKKENVKNLIRCSSCQVSFMGRDWSGSFWTT